MTMHTTDGSTDPYAYADPPTMPLRIPAQTDPAHPAHGQATPGQPIPGQSIPDQPLPGQSIPGQDEPQVHPTVADIPTQVAPTPEGQTPDTSPSAPEKAPASTGRNGLIMAMGSLASRILGFGRSAMIVAALGTHEVGDAFNIGNSLPNIVYMMLIGGALASVFVPELVHAAQTHKDGGVAYTDRLLTICTVALIVLTVAAWFAAPLIADGYAGYPPGAKRDLTIAFARYCLPQIFFYGMFTLFGQVLNARDRFGAMMWTPVLNNVVAIAVFGLYMVVGSNAQTAGEVTSTDKMLLGLGSTLGIVVQAVGLLPSLRSSGFRWRPRFDWRGTGLGKPLRSAGWALLLVVVTQLSFAVISQLSTRAGDRASSLHLPGLGNVAYTNAYQLFVVPQGIITISLVTALLPQMSRAATAGELTRIGADLAGMLRSSAAMIITATALFVTFASQICAIAYGHGHTSPADTEVIGETLVAFGIGLPAFCAQYALARGFYALGDARTPFWLTVITTGANSGLSYVAYVLLSPRWIIIGMAAAQTVAVVISIVITGLALGRRLRRSPAPAGPTSAAATADGRELSDATLNLGTLDLGSRRPRVRSGLDGLAVTMLHVALAVACVPGALAGHWAAARLGSTLGGGTFGNLAGLCVGSVIVLLSLFLFARPLGAGAAVAPLARKLRIPYPAPAAAGGKHRR